MTELLPANDSISEYVIDQLARRGEQRQVFAARLGKSPTWATQKLSGKRRWTVDDLDVLGAYFGVHPMQFFVPITRRERPDTHGYQDARGFSKAA